MDHPTLNAGKPKGIKQVLLEQGLWRQGLNLECKYPKQCSVDSIDCCARRLLSQQPDFLEQKSSVQEVIDAAGSDVLGRAQSPKPTQAWPTWARPSPA